MSRRILVILAIVVVAAFFYFEYASHDAGRAGASGDVYSNDPSPSKVKTEADASDRKTSTASDGQAVIYPTTTSQGTATSPPSTTPAADEVAQPGVAGTRGSAPATDTISPNPPNGMVFSGKGKYQLYRQGNITWRLDTETGKSCIIFATEEEWKKEKVLRAGCGGK